MFGRMYSTSYTVTSKADNNFYFIDTIEIHCNDRKIATNNLSVPPVLKVLATIYITLLTLIK